jgi:glycerophosphoryl diester phosphodiesterase
MPGRARENTLASFALALDAGADGIELDVHATADGAIVVHHDPTLADGRAIALLDLVDVRGEDADSATRIPTLGEVCDLVDGRAELFVEIKGDGIEMQVLAALDPYDGPLAIHSFDHALIARLADAETTRRLGILLEEEPVDLPTLMSDTGALDVWPHYSLVTPDLVRVVHAAEGRVIAWTVNDAREAGRLAALGVDGICGDDVTRI